MYLFANGGRRPDMDARLSVSPDGFRGLNRANEARGKHDHGSNQVEDAVNGETKEAEGNQ